MSAGRPAPDTPGAGATADPPTNWNLPNALTALRILLVPLFGWLLLHDGGQDTGYRIWAFVVFLGAILTDKIDGDIARKRNLVTEFGKLMDPIADKALTGMAFVGLSIVGELWWWVTILVLGREWGITLMRFWVIKYGVMPASRGGKIKTTLQFLALCGLVLPLRHFTGVVGDIADVLWWAALLVMAAAVAFTIVTGVDYVREALRLRREDPSAATRSRQSPSAS
ncbi:MAG: CDP-diacylglycerol--glycerol-3-phosphate 3-phosphatidyltransferase [Nocardioidaceae bacterium]|nr:CDP-diacylglycerol--glycerol-3-phosphate 3-phosphatidyltransferase [Nocardioidaceae bacterium]